MKLIEELKLKEVIKKIRKYKDEHRSIKFFYRDLDNLKLPSLQDFSFKKDDEFFDEVNFILSVIVSIIAHPSLSNKGEDIIVRSELAGHISSVLFNKYVKIIDFGKKKMMKWYLNMCITINILMILKFMKIFLSECLSILYVWS